MRRAAWLFLPILFGLGFSCAPGGRGGTVTGGGSGVSRGSGGSAATIADVDGLRSLLSEALCAGRAGWSDPPAKGGERLRWRVSSTGSPDMVIEMSRGEGEPPHWTLTRGPAGAKDMPDRAEVVLAADSVLATRLLWTIPGAKAALVEKPAELAALFPRADLLDDAAFVASGGKFLGNEVVRVAAGEFRARHALLERGGSLWHFYVARMVPGGVVKQERFAPGSDEPALTMELEDFTRLKGPPPTPLPVPPALATPAPTDAPR